VFIYRQKLKYTIFVRIQKKHLRNNLLILYSFFGSHYSFEKFRRLKKDIDLNK